MTEVPQTTVPEESVVRFGAGESLLGLITIPRAPAVARPAVVLLNAGVIHRIGPHRMSVVLARSFATAGFTAMRFDLGGLGDSRVTRADLSYRDRAVSEARSAIDCLARNHGVSRVVLLGLCSGADNGIATALADPRVEGLVMIDPHTYVTARARARRLVRMLRSGALEEVLRGQGGVRRVASWCARRVRARLQREAESSGRASQSKGGREVPPVETFGQWLRHLIERRVSILSIYSGAHGERYNHEDQLFEVFPDLRGSIDRAWFPDANHTFTPRAVQRRLVDVTTTWLERRFPLDQ